MAILGLVDATDKLCAIVRVHVEALGLALVLLCFNRCDEELAAQEEGQRGACKPRVHVLPF